MAGEDLISWDLESNNTVIFDAGEKSCNTPIEAEFWFTNNSEDTIFISVKASCGCTTSDYSKVVSKNERGFIKLTVTLLGQIGNIIKSASVLIKQGDISFAKIIYVKAKQIQD